MRHGCRHWTPLQSASAQSEMPNSKHSKHHTANTTTQHAHVKITAHPHTHPAQNAAHNAQEGEGWHMCCMQQHASGTHIKLYGGTHALESLFHLGGRNRIKPQNKQTTMKRGGAETEAKKKGERRRCACEGKEGGVNCDGSCKACKAGRRGEPAQRNKKKGGEAQALLVFILN